MVCEKYKAGQFMMHRRFFKVAGMTIQFDSELPIHENTLAEKFKLFEVDGPGDDNVQIIHHFSLPDQGMNFGEKIYSKSPWVIYKNVDEWVYVLEASADPDYRKARQISFVNCDHTKIEVYNSDLVKEEYHRGDMGALTFSPTDQVFLSRLLADRSGCYFHSDGIKMDEQGFLFVGHSGAGKSTIATLLQDKAEILCDDRMILRKWENGYHIHGNWSHGTLPIVSAASAPIKGIFFLEQSKKNKIVPVKDRMESIKVLLACLIKPMTTADWWESMLTLIEDVAQVVPCYRLYFDESGAIYHELKNL